MDLSIALWQWFLNMEYFCIAQSKNKGNLKLGNCRCFGYDKEIKKIRDTNISSPHFLAQKGNYLKIILQPFNAAPILSKKWRFVKVLRIMKAA